MVTRICGINRTHELFVGRGTQSFDSESVKKRLYVVDESVQSCMHL